MAEFASNTPISGPLDNSWDTDWDCNGWSWSYTWGLFFGSPTDDLVPIKKPTVNLRPMGWGR